LNHSEVDHIVFQLRYIIPQITNEKELIVLAYVYLYPDNIVEQLQVDNHFSSPNSVYNYISHLRKAGAIVGKKKEIKLNPGIYLTKDPILYEFTLKISEYEHQT